MSALLFDEASHRYTLNGKRLPSVTQVLQLLGGYEDVPAHLLENARDRGIAAHRATELDDFGELDYGSLSDELLPYLMAWQRFKADTGVQILTAEERVYHPKLGYAGTIDARGIMRGKHAVIDKKCTFRLMPTTAPQTAGYMAAFNEGKAKREQITHRYSVLLKPDGTYNLTPYTDPADWSVFLSCLNIHKWKELHNAKR